MAISPYSPKTKPSQTATNTEESCFFQYQERFLVGSAELNTSLYANFIDYSKAFNSIDRNTLWKIMANQTN